MEITKKKFCISKRLLFLLGILFSIVILTTLVFYTKESITLFSKASENNSSKICAIDLRRMKNTNNCCNNDELNKGYRCYRDYYSINCNTKDVVKCGRNNCNNETGLCKNQPSTILVNNPIAILPTMPQYNSKPDLCDGRYLKDVNWQKTCCSDDDIKTGRFKCIETEDGTGKTIYYQFHCSAQRYWKCDGNCSKWVGLKKITYPTCNKIIEKPFYEVLTSALIVTETPTQLKPCPTGEPNYRCGYLNHCNDLSSVSAGSQYFCIVNGLECCVDPSPTPIPIVKPEYKDIPNKVDRAIATIPSMKAGFSDFPDTSFPPAIFIGDFEAGKNLSYIQIISNNQGITDLSTSIFNEQHKYGRGAADIYVNINKTISFRLLSEAEKKKAFQSDTTGLVTSKPELLFKYVRFFEVDFENSKANGFGFVVNDLLASIGTNYWHYFDLHILPDIRRLLIPMHWKKDQNGVLNFDIGTLPSFTQDSYEYDKKCLLSLINKNDCSWLLLEAARLGRLLIEVNGQTVQKTNFKYGGSCDSYVINFNKLNQCLISR
jgi:hypothetical protein